MGEREGEKERERDVAEGKKSVIRDKRLKSGSVCGCACVVL